MRDCTAMLADVAAIALEAVECFVTDFQHESDVINGPTAEPP